MKTYTITLHNGITITAELSDANLEHINSPYHDTPIGRTVMVEIANDDGNPIKTKGLITSVKVVEEHG